MTIDMTIYLIDDDDAVRKTLTRSLTHVGYEVESFDSGKAFLEKIDSKHYGAIILDVAMPGISGLEVQKELISLGCQIPIIFMTGHGDVPTSVRAIKNGAVEFLEKPFDLDLLIERLDEALSLDRSRMTTDQSNQEILERFQNLTKRESHIMTELAAGRADRSNKELARVLNLSHRTVEEYRARIMKKMGASSITHLVEMAKTCDIYRQ